MIKFATKMLKPICQAFLAFLNNIMQTASCISTSPSHLISQTCVKAPEFVVIPFALVVFTSPGFSSLPIYSVISIIHLHQISTDFTRKCVENIQLCTFCMLRGGGGGGGALVGDTVKPINSNSEGKRNVVRVSEEFELSG